VAGRVMKGGMRYHLGKMLYTLQGEGANAGRAAVLCRFDAAKRQAAQRSYGSAAELVRDMLDLWPGERRAGPPVSVVCTGADLLAQLDQVLMTELHQWGCHVAAELDGAQPAPEGLDWITVKPRPGQQLTVRRGQELKIEFPVEGLDPRDFEELQFQYHFIQPVADERWKGNTASAIRYCLNNPLWRLSYQVQMAAGFP